MTLNGSGVGGRGALRNVSGANTWSGAITLGASAAIHNADTANTLTLGSATNGIGGATFTLTVAGEGDTEIEGIIGTTTGGLTKTGGGTLTLSAANSYTGDTKVEGGTLKLGRNTAINAGSKLVVDGGTFDLAGRNNTFNGVQLIDGTIDDTGRDVSGTLTKGALTLSTGNYDLKNGTVNAVLGGASAGLEKNEKTGADNPGVVILTANNTYNGATTINSGVLRITNKDALGNTTGDTTVTAGGTLELALSGSNNIPAGEALTLNGTGHNNRGALRNVNGTNTWSGAIRVATGATIHNANTTGTAPTLILSNTLTLESTATTGRCRRPYRHGRRQDPHYGPDYGPGRPD